MLKPINVKDILIDRNQFRANEWYRLINDSLRTSAGQYVTIDNQQIQGNVANKEITRANVTTGSFVIPTVENTQPYGMNHLFRKSGSLPPGLYENEIIEFRAVDDPPTNQLSQIHYLFYKVFYKATLSLTFDSIIRPVDATVSYNNLGPTLNPIHTIDWTGSEGDLGITFEVLRKNNLNVYVTALVGSDYEIINSTSTTREIRFLSEGEYRVRTASNGYTSNNNPYPNSNKSPAFMNRSNNAQARKVLTNSVVRNINVNVYLATGSGPAPVIVEDITFPKINPKLEILDPNYILDIAPLTTYVLIDVNITPVIDYLSASFIRSTNGIPATINLNNMQWLEKTEDETTVDLLILNSALSVHQVYENVKLDETITYGFYPDDNYEIYYNVKLK